MRVSHVNGASLGFARDDEHIDDSEVAAEEGAASEFEMALHERAMLSSNSIADDSEADDADDADSGVIVDSHSIDGADQNDFDEQSDEQTSISSESSQLSAVEQRAVVDLLVLPEPRACKHCGAQYYPRGNVSALGPNGTRSTACCDNGKRTLHSRGLATLDELPADVQAMYRYQLFSVLVEGHCLERVSVDCI